MKRAMLGLAMTAGLLASTLAVHAPAARADGVSGINCGMTNVNVTATATDHHYEYSYGCYFFGSGFPLRVIADATADYDTTDHTASESIHSHYAGESYVSTWNCASDPWAIDADPTNSDSLVACSLHFDHLTGDRQTDALVAFWSCYNLNGTHGPDWAWGAGSPVCPASLVLPSDGPLSAPVFDQAARHVLAAQLQNALKQVPAASPDPGRIPTTPMCIPCALAGSSGSSATGGGLPAPSSFTGHRDNLYGTTDILSWQSVPGADYYKLTAQGHVSGAPLAVNGGADIAAGATSFTVDGTAAEVTGGTDFFLQACSVANGCGAKAQTTVVGP